MSRWHLNEFPDNPKKKEKKKIIKAENMSSLY